MKTAHCAVSAQIALAAHLAVVRTAPEAQTVLLGLAMGLVGLAEGLKMPPLIGGIFTQVAT